MISLIRAVARTIIKSADYNSNMTDIETAVNNLLTAVPTGGTDGQVLTKQSASDYDADWEDASGGVEDDMWVAGADTWNFGSATTFTISGVDRTSIFTKGTKIKLTNDGSTKYYYVVSSSFATNTTVTLTGEVDLVSGAITNPFYSYADNPQGFKRAEDWYKCSVYPSGGEQAITTATITKVEFNTKEFDPNGDFDNTTDYEYTAPISGYYTVFSTIRYKSLSDQDFYQCRLHINGSENFTNLFYAAAAGNPSGFVSKTVYLEKGDTVDIRAYHTHGSNINLEDSSPSMNLSIAWQGL